MPLIVDKEAVRNDLKEIQQEDQPDIEECLAEGLSVFRAMKNVTDAEHMLQEDHALVTEAVIQEVYHICGAGTEAEFP